MENLFERGCLVQFSAGVWGATRKIDLSKYVELDSSPDWLRANKKLVHPDALKPMQKIVNATRGYLMRVSLPFPLNSMVFVPKDMINGVDQRLNNFKNKFDDQVRVFVNSYDHLRETAITNLGDLFNQFDYPVDISAKFSFAWRFIVLDVPNGKSGILSPEVYAREKEKFVRTMEEARQMAIDCLREEFSSMVERMSPNGSPQDLTGSPRFSRTLPSTIFTNTSKRSRKETFFVMRNLLSLCPGHRRFLAEPLPSQSGQTGIYGKG